MVMMNLTRNDGTEPATFVTALREPVEMAVTIEDSEDDRLLPALSTKSVSVGFRAITQFSSVSCSEFSAGATTVSYTCGSA